MPFSSATVDCQPTLPIVISPDFLVCVGPLLDYNTRVLNSGWQNKTAILAGGLPSVVGDWWQVLTCRANNIRPSGFILNNILYSAVQDYHYTEPYICLYVM